MGIRRTDEIHYVLDGCKWRCGRTVLYLRGLQDSRTEVYEHGYAEAGSLGISKRVEQEKPRTIHILAWGGPMRTLDLETLKKLAAKLSTVACLQHGMEHMVICVACEGTECCKCSSMFCQCENDD